MSALVRLPQLPTYRCADLSAAKGPKPTLPKAQQAMEVRENRGGNHTGQINVRAKRPCLHVKLHNSVALYRPCSFLEVRRCKFHPQSVGKIVVEIGAFGPRCLFSSSECTFPMQNGTFIHIGVSRTATTSLQRNVFHQLEGVLFLGKPGAHERHGVVPGFSKYHSAMLENTLEAIIENKPYQRDNIRELANVIADLKGSKLPVIFSDERLSENKHIGFSDIALYLREIFGPAELVVTVRNPLTALPSAYLHEVMRFSDASASFSEWLDDVISNPRRIKRQAESLEQYRYTLMLDQFRTIFDGKISVLRYEDLLADVSAFSHSLALIIGNNAGAIEKLLRLSPHNSTASRRWYRYRRVVQKLGGVGPFQHLRSVALATRLNETLGRWAAKGPKENVSLSDYDRSRIAEHFPYNLPAWVREFR